MPVRTLALLLLLCSPVLLRADAPRVFSFDGADLDRARQHVATDPHIAAAVQTLRHDADALLDLKPPAVTDKQHAPASGDRHDYMSIGPYWWPDPAKPDGLPWIRRDGQVNPEREQYDLPRLEKFSSATETLALAYYFTNDPRYADKAAALIRVWFFDDATRMNPNGRYAQVVPGHEDEIRGIGLIETNRLRRAIDAAALLAGSPAWPADNDRRLRAWFADYLRFLLDSPQGKAEAAAKNNHGTWYAVQTITYALYLNDEKLARTLVDRFGEPLIASQIEPDGRQPLELERQTSFDYARFNLIALESLADLADRLNVDLWHYQTPDGRSIRQAVDWIVPYATGEKTWEHAQIKPAKAGESAELLRRAARGLHDPKYEALISHLPAAHIDETRLVLEFPPAAPTSRDSH